MVAEALHIPSQQRVAIKKVSNIFDNESDSIKFLREISILRLLEHSNVVKLREIYISDSFDTFNELYLILDHAKTDLRKILRSPIHFQEEHIK
mmetsp:Transcript_29301/g.5290  ORF Transcript_29301/g.5290 Transcript_29301/m.5290 type:complete len:93 (-) Transcript_29301:842-1120(-)